MLPGSVAGLLGVTARPSAAADGGAGSAGGAGTAASVGACRVYFLSLLCAAHPHQTLRNEQEQMHNRVDVESVGCQ